MLILDSFGRKTLSDTNISFLVFAVFFWGGGELYRRARQGLQEGNSPKSLVQTAIRISVLLQGLQASGETREDKKEGIKREKKDRESVGDLM